MKSHNIACNSLKNENDTVRDQEKGLDFSQKDFRHQFPKNLGTNILLFIVNVLIGIWLVPFFIKNLGVASYGLIPLVMSLTHYIGLVTLAISGGTSRFLTIALQQNDFERANRTFNTIFWSLLFLITVLIPLLAISASFLSSFFQIPPDQLLSFKWLFSGTVGAFLLSTFSSSFSSSTLAYNRLDLRNFSQIVKSVSRVILTVLFFNMFSPSLENVALATFIAAFFSLGLDYYFWRKLTPNLVIKFSFFDKKLVGTLTSLGGWIVVNQIGALLFLQIELIVVNRFWGPTQGGEYASVLQWSMLLRSMSGVLAGVIHPMLMICYARADKENMIKISKLAVKSLGLGMAVPIGFACGFSSELLNIWLGPNFIKLSTLLVIMLFHLSVNLSVTPLLSLNLCYNKVRIPGVVTFLMGILNLLLAILLPLVFDLGVYGVAIAGAFVLTLKNAIFTPWYAAHIVGGGIQIFSREILYSLIATSLVFIFCAMLSKFLIINTWGLLFLTGFFVTALFLFFVYFVVLSQEEQMLLRSLVIKGVRRQ